MPGASDERTPRDSSADAPKQFAAEIAVATHAALLKFLDDPRLDEEHLLVLLSRKDLPVAFLEEFARRRGLLTSYGVRRSLAFHPHVPRVLAMRLARELHLMDLVKLSQTPAAPPEVRRIAEEQLLARLPQVPLGQKIALARQATARVLAALIVEGVARVVEPALQNPRLTEAQVLKLLTKEKLPSIVVPAICRHARWESFPNVRLALLRHPQTPHEAVQRILPHIPLGDLRALARLKTISEIVRRHIERELARR